MMPGTMMLVTACGGSDADFVEAGAGAAPSIVASGAALEADSTWYWQLQGTLDTTIDADVYDIDLFESSPQFVDELQAKTGSTMQSSS